MFGKKQIANLKTELFAAKKDAEEGWANYKNSYDAREKLSTELDQALEALTSSEQNITDLTEELVRERTINQALADENRDLTRQLQLLQALFKQIGIQIKLPAKKND